MYTAGYAHPEVCTQLGMHTLGMVRYTHPGYGRVYTLGMVGYTHPGYGRVYTLGMVGYPSLVYTPRVW